MGLLSFLLPPLSAIPALLFTAALMLGVGYGKGRIEGRAICNGRALQGELDAARKDLQAANDVARIKTEQAKAAVAIADSNSKIIQELRNAPSTPNCTVDAAAARRLRAIH